MEVLEQFVDKLVAEKKLGKLDPEVFVQVKKDLLERLETRINAVMLEHMPPEQLEVFDTLLSSKAGPEKVQAFCAEHIPNLDEKVAAALLQFRATYLGI